MIRIHHLRCEYKRNPVGIDIQRPRISWQLASAARGVKQAAYRIQAAEDEAFQHLVWDTGKIDGDRSVNVEYQGEPLRSRTRYYWRACVWTDAAADAASSEWSDTAYWETALLDRSEWRASWITAAHPDEEAAAEACDYLRTAFSVHGKVAAARIYATARGLYRLYLNGQRPDDSLFTPGWTSYNKRLQYQVYDVTELLAAGENAIGVMLANGWYKGNLAWEGKREFYGKRRALLLQLHIAYADGAEQVVCSDGTWTWHGGPLLRSEVYHGETYDARLEEPGWHEPGFDAARWSPAAIIDEAYSNLIAQQNNPVRKIEELRPIAVLTTPGGDTVVDMGQNMVGWVRISAESTAGTAIQLQHAEVLDREGNFYIGNLRTAEQTVSYICKGGGTEAYEPYFSFQGFRYVKVTGLPQEGLAARLVGCVIHTDMEPTGSFVCSDAMINQLQRNIVWGQKGNFLDVPTDCPQRDERLGWTGDAQVFIRTAAFNYQVAPFFTKWLQDLAADQLPDGGVPHVVPDIPIAGYNSSAWGDAAVICPWTIYECYDDTRILETQYASMKAWVEYIRAQGEDECLWNTGFHFGDWLALDAKENSFIGATPKDYIASAFYAYSTGLLAKTAAALGNPEEEARYAALYERVVAAFRSEFVTPNGRVASPTQTACVLALMFDLLEEKDRDRTARMLADNVRENGIHLTTGFVGTPYLCLVLSRFGYTDLAYELALQRDYPSWLYSITKGATTIWEHWDGIKPDGSFWSEGMNSYNHYAYGSIGDWLYRVVAGIDMEAPGYRKIRIQPHPNAHLSFAEASLKSMYGDIVSSWKLREDGTVVLNVAIPANTTATVVLSANSANITLEGRRVEEVEGVQRVDGMEEQTRIDIGSGAYCFEYRRP